ncbi:MAG: hypothetical protein WCK67_08170 [bacterium]
MNKKLEKLRDIVNKYPKLYLLMLAIILLPLEIILGLLTLLCFVSIVPAIDSPVDENLGSIFLLISFTPSLLLTTLWILRKTNIKYLNMLTVIDLPPFFLTIRT